MINMINKNMQRHFKAIIPKLTVRPILQTVNYNSETKLISVTDSHRLLSIHDPNIEQSFNINLDTMLLDLTPYPDISRLYPEINKPVTIDTSIFQKHHLPIVKGLKDTILTIVFSDDMKIFTDDNINIITIPLKDGYYENATMHLNAKYLHDFLHFIITTQPNCEINMQFTSPVRPLYFYNEYFKYLIVPVRKG